MNELKIFKNKELSIRTVTINGETEYMVNGVIFDRFRLLALACEEDDKNEAWKIMNVASTLYHPLDDCTFNSLYGAVAMEITRHSIKREFYYQDLFNKNYSKVRKGKVVKNKCNGKDIPDSWVFRDGHLIPVEVKLNSFDKKALKQLNRYIKVYGCKYGIAVANKLTTELPKEIEFISHNELTDAN